VYLCIFGTILSNLVGYWGAGALSAPPMTTPVLGSNNIPDTGLGDALGDKSRS